MRGDVRSKVIDIISTKQDRTVVLTISDHLDWETTTEHLLILQEKINSYLAFLESGEIYENYPSAKGQALRIHVVFQHQPNPVANSFLSNAKSIVEAAGFGFGFELFSASPFEI